VAPHVGAHQLVGDRRPAPGSRCRGPGAYIARCLVIRARGEFAVPGTW
jgi:hypothetical protein